MERIQGKLTITFLQVRKAERLAEQREAQAFEAECHEIEWHKTQMRIMRKHHAEVANRSSALCTSSKVSMSKCLRKTKRH